MGEAVGHASQVTEMTVELARVHRYRSKNLVKHKQGAPLQDISKMEILDGILLKAIRFWIGE